MAKGLNIHQAKIMVAGIGYIRVGCVLVAGIVAGSGDAGVTFVRI
jgi:hypothetical protein